MFKKILIGVGVAIVALIALGCTVETDTPTSEAPPAATEAPVVVEPTATPVPEPTTPTVTPKPVTVISLAGCRPADDIRCAVYRTLFPLISAEYFSDESVEFTDADFNWVDCVATVASEHLFLDSSQELVEQALLDGLNACGQ